MSSIVTMTDEPKLPAISQIHEVPLPLNTCHCLGTTRPNSWHVVDW